MRSSYLNPAPLKTAMLLACIIGFCGWGCSAPTANISSNDTRITQTSAEKAPVQLADEIIRRLRRLGLNFTKTRVPNPYSPYGEIC